MNLKSLLLTLIATTGMTGSAMADETPTQPTEEQRALANQTITDGNYRIYTVVGGTKYYLYSQSNRQVLLTADKSSASEYAFSYKTGLGKWVDDAWRICYDDTYRFSNGSNSSTNGQTYLSMAESKNDRADFERQVLFAQEDAENAGEYVYAVRATNATCDNELTWQAWSKNCYWTVNTSADLPYPCYDVENAGKGSFIWKIETTKESYAPIETYDIADITAEEFAKNPAKDMWRFEKYDYSTGKYSLFTQYSDSNAANYVDIYQPCRAGGERIVEIEGLEGWSNNNTFAMNPRYGWSDYAVYNNGGTTNQSKERFCYVTRDEHFGYEVYSNDEYASVISFVVPADGFYQMDATMLRQDVPASVGLLSVVPRYRYSTNADINYANTKFGMNRMLFGQIGGEIDGFVAGSAHLNAGAAQRYIAQEPTAVSMSFEGKKGDIISFEVNSDSTGVKSSWARDYYGRAFYQSLVIAEVTETYARQNENFADTYGESEDVETLKQLVEEYEEFVNNADCGNNFGQYSIEIANELMELTGAVYDAIDNGEIHAFNAPSYIEELQTLYRKFIESKIDIDYSAEGNYPLFTTDAVTGEVKYNPEILADNTDNPWGYYYYEVANGTYNKFVNHNTSSKAGTSIDAWYKGTGDWLYIADNGALHPMTNYAPAIMFTAPKDGVYKVNFGCYRPNPNASIENPLWIRARFLDSATSTQDKDIYMFAKEFGSVANDGEGGKAPITMEYYVNMKAGDKITWELDCYTCNRNSSAGTQITTLTVCAGIDAESPYTLENIPAEADIFDAYTAGDPSTLSIAIATAQTTLNKYKDNVGTDGGQYSAALCEALETEISKASAMAENGDTQYNMDLEVVALNAAAEAFEASRMPFEIFIEGSYAINLVDTEKYLTQKNKNGSGSNYYAAMTDYAGVVADATKNSKEVTEYNWTFTFKKITKQVSTGEYDESTGEEITVPVEQTSIYGNDGYVSTLGYVQQTADETAAPAFRFFKYNADDEAFAIMNEDGAYWNGSFTWSSPYDKMNTTSTPNYIFVLSDMTLEKATSVETVETNAAVVSTQYYSLSGARIASPKQGVNIRQQRLSDGRIVTSKILVK